MGSHERDDMIGSDLPSLIKNAAELEVIGSAHFLALFSRCVKYHHVTEWVSMASISTHDHDFMTVEEAHQWVCSH